MVSRFLNRVGTTMGLLIRRAGESATIKRPDGTATTNKYNKVSDTDQTFSAVADELAARTYESMDERPNDASVSGGRIETDSPIIIFREDTVAQEDDIVTFPDNETYILDERVPQEGFNAFRTTQYHG